MAQLTCPQSLRVEPLRLAHAGPTLLAVSVGLTSHQALTFASGTHRNECTLHDIVSCSDNCNLLALAADDHTRNCEAGKGLDRDRVADYQLHSHGRPGPRQTSVEGD